jgi:NADH dehydrogenase [ubiquinone] 1 alpha subcomplex assembly factor 7
MQPPDPVGEALERARRLGPLPYSAQGLNPAPALPPGPIVAGWLVDAVDAWWIELGRPDPFTLVEVGAGDGSRAAAFLASGPECLTALRYVLVEEDAALRHQHPTYLPIESPIFVLGPVDADGDGDDDEAARPVAGIGPLLTSLAEPPVVDVPAVVVALGWLSRLPSDRVEWRDGTWWEVRLAAAADDRDAELSELLVPLDEPRATAVVALTEGSARPEGGRFALLGPAVEWLGRTVRVAEAGRLAVIDRWSGVTSPLPEGEVPPLALDQLAAVRRPLEPAPEELFPSLAIVTWRLG